MGRNQLYCGGFRAARLAQDLEQLISELICFPDRTPRNWQDTYDRCGASITIDDRGVSGCTIVVDLRGASGLFESFIKGNNASATGTAKV